MKLKIYILIVFLFSIIAMRAQISDYSLPDSFYNGPCGCPGQYHLGPYSIGAFSTGFSYTKKIQTGYDIFYEFYISTKMDIVVSNITDEGNDSYIFILSPDAKILYEAYNSTQSKINVKNLPSGRYFIWIRETGGSPYMTTSVVGKLPPVVVAEPPTNYVKKEKPTTAIAYTTAPSTSNYLATVEYYDGLGRPVQNIQMLSGLNGGDFASLIEYDAFGRKSVEWLPIAVSNNNGAYVSKEKIMDYANKKYGDNAPYSRTDYENSPLNRVLKHYGPGQDWYNNSKAVSTAYFTNKGISGVYACIKFKVTGAGVSTKLERTGYYSDGMLYVTRITDENGSVSYEFKNKLVSCQSDIVG
ncbi:hypothetical protein D0T84_21590 [Dysgonomonas sp. 521]|uniref:DUF6443 domain-containing protein n=1 Tax=Dysgonomonas sp. 521 TaxID=2302932 RepID=UPI001C8678D0|nr:DUF6443 domain-containing protein [Dysgonomonas sp. 521]NDV97465.1 hypothetical protein [Dysgonomonas sp. 521]